MAAYNHFAKVYDECNQKKNVLVVNDVQRKVAATTAKADAILEKAEDEEFLQRKQY